MKILNKQRLAIELKALFRRLQEGNLEGKADADFDKALAGLLHHQELEQDDELTRYVSILICDIRGFSQLVENVPPAKVIKILNVFFSTMVSIIDRFGGQVNKFMGDSLIAFFDCEDDARESVLKVLECAITMQLAMDEVNQKSHELGMNDVYMGIGINTGEVVASVFGSDIYSEFTIIGTPVNVASRIEGYTLRGQILLSENTRQLVSDVIETSERNEVSAKGMKDPLQFYELLAITEPSHIELPRRDNRRAPRFNIKIPVNYQVLDGKNVLQEVFEGQIVDISYGGMMMTTSHPVQQFADIKMSMLLSPLSKNPIDLYAKAVYVQSHPEGFEVGLEFTSIPETASATLKYYVDNIL